MAKRDILKEAIADAKTVKETAIANAKAALEEAFTPQLKSMLAAKLEEMELDEEKEDDMQKEGMGKSYYEDDEMTKEGMKDDKKMDEEINLDEILAELDEEMEKDNLNEDEATDKEEEGFLDGKKDGEEEEKKDMEDEEIDLEDMTDDDLKDFIEDVIADMVKSGELEAGDNFEEEGEEEEVDVDVEDDVDVEISEAKKKDKDEDKDKDLKESIRIIQEIYGSGGASGAAAGAAAIAKGLSKLGVNVAALGRKGVEAIKDMIEKAGGKLEDLLDFSEPAYPMQKKLRDAGTGKPQKFQGRYEEDGIEEAKKDDEDVKEAKAKKDEEELKEAYNTIESLRSDLHEVNLLNAKLLYTNKIFKAKTLTESQKVKVLGAFDKAGTVKETKLVFETLNEGLKAKKKSPITESLGAASRVSRSVNAKKPIIETDPMVERFKKLAGIK